MSDTVDWALAEQVAALEAAEHDVPHGVVHPGFEDGVLMPGSVTPSQWVASLAYLKAWAGAASEDARASGGRVVVGADTACLLQSAWRWPGLTKR